MSRSSLSGSWTRRTRSWPIRRRSCWWRISSLLTSLKRLRGGRITSWQRRQSTRRYRWATWRSTTRCLLITAPWDRTSPTCSTNCNSDYRNFTNDRTSSRSSSRTTWTSGTSARSFPTNQMRRTSGSIRRWLPWKRSVNCWLEGRIRRLNRRIRRLERRTWRLPG